MKSWLCSVLVTVELGDGSSEGVKRGECSGG